jgi:hypothetical protein
MRTKPIYILLLVVGITILASGCVSDTNTLDTQKTEKTTSVATVTEVKQTTTTSAVVNTTQVGKYTTYEQVFSHSKKIDEWIKIGEIRDFEVFGTNVRVYTYIEPGSGSPIQMLPPALPKNQKLLVNMIYKNTVTGNIVDYYRDTDHSHNAWSDIAKTKNPDEVLWQVEFGLMTDEPAVKQQPKKTIVQ